MCCRFSQHWQLTVRENLIHAYTYFLNLHKEKPKEHNLLNNSVLSSGKKKHVFLMKAKIRETK